MSDTTSLPTQVDETVIVEVGLLGHVERGIGSAHAHGELTGDAGERARQVGAVMGEAYRHALVDAIREYQSQMVNHWRDQGNADSGPVPE